MQLCDPAAGEVRRLRGLAAPRITRQILGASHRAMSPTSRAVRVELTDATSGAARAFSRPAPPGEGKVQVDGAGACRSEAAATRDVGDDGASLGESAGASRVTQ
jgi:hypothetical protein